MPDHVAQVDAAVIRFALLPDGKKSLNTEDTMAFLEPCF